MAVPRGRSRRLSDIRFLLYRNSTTPASYSIGKVVRLVDDPAFDPVKPTVIHIAGYLQVVTDPTVAQIVRAYQRHGGYNLVILDWANLAYGGYISVSLDHRPIGVAGAEAVLTLLRNGLALENLHLLGHSMGSHIAAVLARELKKNNLVVPRLTALDPALPGFYPSLLGEGLTKDDAGFVDVIHTDSGAYGAPSAVGHVDFWPNGGTAKQPGCQTSIPFTTEDFCSHWRSEFFWAESVEGGQFLAEPCPDFETWQRGECAGASPALMGLQTATHLRGNYYLRTAASEPFALGKRGLSSESH